jgi:hypothetical protein
MAKSAKVKKSKKAPRVKNACTAKRNKASCDAAKRCNWTKSKKTKCRRASRWVAALKKHMKAKSCTLKKAMVALKGKKSLKVKKSVKPSKASKRGPGRPKKSSK